MRVARAGKPRTIEKPTRQGCSHGCSHRHRYPGTGRGPAARRRGRGALRQDDAPAVRNRRQHLPDRARGRGAAPQRRGRDSRGRGRQPPRRVRAAQGRRHQPGGPDGGPVRDHGLLQVHAERGRGERRGGLGAHPAGHNPRRAQPPPRPARHALHARPEHQQPRQRGRRARQQLLRRPLSPGGARQSTTCWIWT